MTPQSNLLSYQRRLQSIVSEYQQRAAVTDFMPIEAEDASTKVQGREAREKIFEEFCKILSSPNISASGECFRLELASIRSRRGASASFLRTVHSRPPSLAEIFNQPQDYKSFQFKFGSFGSRFKDGLCFEEGAFDELGYAYIAKLYNTQMPTQTPQHGTFDRRISRFLDTVFRNVGKLGLEADSLFTSEGSGDQTKAIPTERISQCIVIGCAQRNDDGISENSDISDLIALYGHGNFVSLSQDYRIALATITGITLSAFADVERFDREAFRRDSLRVVAELTPNFADREQATSDNISMLLDRLDKVFEKHSSFGTSTSTEDVTVRFIKVDFLDDGAEGAGPILPKTSIYPLFFARQIPLAATWFSSRSSVSVVKQLLGKWLCECDWKISVNENNEREIDENFRRRYESVTNLDGVYWGDEAGSFRECSQNCSAIYATQQSSPSFWEELSFSAVENLEKPHVTTAAFLLQPNENAISQKSKIPFGILAFESKVPDAFSAEDLHVLKQLADAVSHIVDLNGWSKVHIDYGSKVREALLKDSFKDYSKVVPKIAFEFDRIDYQILQFWIASNSGEKTESVQKHFKRLSLSLSEDGQTSLTDLESAIKSASKVASFISKQKSSAVAQFSANLNANALWKALPNDDNKQQILLKFLESIPSNPKWGARLSAVPRALLTRQIRSPQFTKIPGGYSADSIFVLDDSNEIRQVLKFASRQKILKERSNYQKFVRYHQPLAARMPRDAFAFDSAGCSPGGEEPGEESHAYGVLISDLVAGLRNAADGGETSGPKSFQDYMFKLATDDVPNKATVEELFGAILHHFWIKSVKWRKVSQDGAFGTEYTKWMSNAPTVDSILNDSSRLVQFDDPKEETEECIDDIFKNDSHHNHLLTFLKNSSLAFETSFEKFYHYDLKHNPEETGRRPTALSELRSSDNTIDFNDFLKQFPKLKKASDLISKFTDTHIKAFEQTLVESIRSSIEVIHGDCNGKNLTWSTAFRQLQLIDFENVRFGLPFTDAVKLAISMPPGFVENELSEDTFDPERSRRCSGAIEELVLSLGSLARACRAAERHAGTGNSRSGRAGTEGKQLAALLNEKYFNKGFALLGWEYDRDDKKEQNDNSSNAATQAIKHLLLSQFGQRDVGLPDDQAATENGDGCRGVDAQLRIMDEKITEHAIGASFISKIVPELLKRIALKEFLYKLKSLDHEDLLRINKWNKFFKHQESEILGRKPKFNEDYEAALRKIKKDKAEYEKKYSIAFNYYQNRLSDENSEERDKIYYNFKSNYYSDQQITKRFAAAPRMRHWLERGFAKNAVEYDAKPGHPDRKIFELVVSYWALLAVSIEW